MWAANQGSDFYVGVNRANQIFQSPGTSGWAQVNGQLSMIDVAGDRIWGVNAADDIFTSSRDFNWVQIAGKLRQLTVSQLYVRLSLYLLTMLR